MASFIQQFFTSFDDEIIKRIANGEENALYELYLNYKKPLFMYALSLVRDYQLAEDVSHDTFINIKEYANTYKEGTNAKAWIFTICRNCAYALLNSRKNEIFVENEKFDYIIDQEYQTSSSNPEFVKKAFSYLNSQEQEIVSLHIYGELRHTEIAEILNLPYSQVRSIYAYALKKMRKNMRKEEYYD